MLLLLLGRQRRLLLHFYVRLEGVWVTPDGIVLFAGHAFMPWLLVAEARAETAIDALDDGLGFTALVDLARFATRTATPPEVGVGVERAPAALLVIA